MAKQVWIPDSHRSALLRAVDRWLGRDRDLRPIPGLAEQTAELDTLHAALRAGGALSRESYDLLPKILAREARRLHKLLEAPDQYLPRFLPPATSGLFKSLRNRKALEEHERINNELLREARSEFAWTKQMLEVMAQWQSVGSETRATATTELIFTAEEIDRYYGGDRSKALYDQGGKFLELHQYEKAEASFRAAIDLNPSFSWAHCNLAITLDDAGRHAEALACIDRAIELDPSDTDFPQRRKEILDNLHRKRGTGA